MIVRGCASITGGFVRRIECDDIFKLKEKLGILNNAYAIQSMPGVLWTNLNKSIRMI